MSNTQKQKFALWSSVIYAFSAQWCCWLVGELALCFCSLVEQQVNVYLSISAGWTYTASFSEVHDLSQEYYFV